MGREAWPDPAFLESLVPRASTVTLSDAAEGVAQSGDCRPGNPGQSRLDRLGAAGDGIFDSMPTHAEPSLGGPVSVVETACPLDCPDACSLAVTVQHGKLVQIDGSHKNPVTDGYICAKVRKFGERVYGPDRLLYPAVRKGRKGDGQVQARHVGRSARADRRSIRAGEARAPAASRSSRTRTADRTDS